MGCLWDMQGAASGQDQLTGWERGLKVLTEVVAVPQSARNTSGSLGSVTLQPCCLCPHPSTCSQGCCCAGLSMLQCKAQTARMLQTPPFPLHGGHQVAGRGGFRLIGNEGCYFCCLWNNLGCITWYFISLVHLWWELTLSYV